MDSFEKIDLEDAFIDTLSDDELAHYGVKRRSGRYPWGSGQEPYQHSGDFLSRVEELQKNGLSEKKIAEKLGMSTKELRLQKSLATHERRQLEVDRAKSLREDGKSLNEIAEIMGYANDSSIRALLKQETADNKNAARVAAKVLKEQLETKGMIDVGAGAELELGISKQKLQEAIRILELEGYNVYGIGIPQVTNPGKQTITPVLTKPDIDYAYTYQNMGDIHSAGEDVRSVDGGVTWQKREYPSSISSNRVMINYAEDGGINKDGVIEIRRGVDDLSLGNSHYAQVRIMVDGTHYLKGMAIYADDLPDGVDVRFNTNKSTGTPKMEVLKKIKNDPDNPFGATIKVGGQTYYDDPDGKYINPLTGKKASLSAVNKLKEEGDWSEMSKNLSSQFLSKQPMQLIRRQLDLTYSDTVTEYNRICALENPTIKRKLLADFANECESSAVHMKAASLPRQTLQVILPSTTLKDNEIYAPNYKNGEQVALIRYPHAGTFEIPVLTVNNNHKQSKSIFGNLRDAVVINSKVAEQLSGADFDGDQVVVIPTNDKVRIKSSKPLRDLDGYDAKTQYAIPSQAKKRLNQLDDDGYSESEIKKIIKKEYGITLMTKADKQKQMGVVSNLITDMTLRGATEQEIARAVKHSQTVIDAEKHHLDYKRSEKENGIAELRQTYQKRIEDDGTEKSGGASTLLSRRKQTVQIPERQGSGRVDEETGKVTYKESGRTYVDKKTGETKQATQAVSRILATDDVRSLSSGTAQENAYADYSNKLKALADRARKESISTGRLTYSPQAKVKYAQEVKELDAAIKVASSNAPKERRAQAIANSVVKAKIQDNPSLSNDKKELMKVKTQALNDARSEVGAGSKGKRIKLTDKQWEAIQAGAISDSKLMTILRYGDADDIRQRATPKTSTQLSKSNIARIKQLESLGYTNAEIAESIGVSASTVGRLLSEEN